MAIAEDTVQKSVEEGLVELTINRPENLNALNTNVLQSLQLIIDDLVREGKTLAVLVTGAGQKAFVAGADIQSMHDLGPRAISDYVELGQRVMRTIEVAPFPVIAAVNGYALGGGLELALACDIILASNKAKMGQPEVNLGIIPGFGGTQRLIQRCGIGVARRLVYTGEIIKAEQALQLGLVDQLYEPESLIPQARELMHLIAAKAPLAVAGAKRVIRTSQEGALLSGLQLEVEEFLKLFQSADREEGMQAFLQKREPKFKGI